MATTEHAPAATSSDITPALEFPSPFTFILNDPVPFVELRLRRFARTIRDKPRWWEKVHDAEIVARWTREIVEHDRAMVEELWGGERRLEEGNGEKQWPRDPITDIQLSYLFDELRYLASQRDEETGMSVSEASVAYAYHRVADYEYQETTIPMVYESSALIPAPLKASLKSLAETLEDVPDDEKDWHPGSGNQVLDLVHPSLFCLRIGRSFVYDPYSGRPDSLRLLTNEEYLRERADIIRCFASDAYYREEQDPPLPFEFTVSKAYQWLPTDFAVSEFGQVSALGYINNLHRVKHAAAYGTVSSILERFLPLFERVIADQLSPPRPPIFPIDPDTWYPIEAPDDVADRDEWERVHRWPEIPDARPFQPPPPPGAGRAAPSLRGRTLQVIVKMANIELTPAAPRYAGGAWHVEGMANERIVATGLYYYASANISESRLAFRAAVGDGLCEGGTFLAYEQWDRRGYLSVYGLTHEHALNQELGHVVAREDKCVAFPNVYQHRVAPFELEDPARPGHRKILAFFLVDPLTRVHSTSDVPPQQAQWYRDAVYGSSMAKKLPPSS